MKNMIYCNKVASRIFAVLILIVSVTCKDYGLSHFRKDREVLYDCIENNFDTHWYQENSKIRKDLINGYAQRFSWHTVNKVSLSSEIRLHVDFLIRRGHIELDPTRPREELEKDLRKALLKCIDEYVDENIDQSSSGSSSDVRALPYFAEEPLEYYRLLNHVLVNWPCIPESLCSTQRRRVELISYAENGLRILESAYSSQCDNFVIYEFWERRARFFFDGRNESWPFSYIDHRYTTDHPFPHTRGDVRMFTGRNTEDFRVRNPSASQQQVDRILELHPVSDLYMGQDGIYVRYGSNGMSSSEYYLEYHLSQFYRILFFYLELVDRGLLNGADDYEVPEDVGALLYNDNFYHDYLIRRRWVELNRSGINNLQRRELARRNSASERDLIMLFWNRIRNGRNFKTSTSTTTVATTRSNIPTTTRKYTESKRGKGKFFRTFKGKCISKNLGLFLDSFMEKDEEKPDTNDSEKFIDSECLLEIEANCNCNNSATDNIIIDKMLFPSDDSLVFVKVISSLLNVISGSSHIFKRHC